MIASKSTTETFVYTSSSASVEYTPTVYSTDAVIVTTRPDGTIESQTVSTVVETVVPASTVYATTIVTSTQSPTSIAGLQAEGLNGSGGNGLSTGAKAGIGAGIGVAVVAAAIIGALYAMRRRKRNRINEDDRYTQSSFGPSVFGAFKRGSRYTDSDGPSQMREANPLDRYATGVSNSQRASVPNQSRNGTSEISSVSGVGSEQFRPGPGMPVVVERPDRHYAAPMSGVSELPDEHYDQHGYAATGRGNPFVNDERTSMYSDESDPAAQPYQDHRTTSPAALELSGEDPNNIGRAYSGGSGGHSPSQGYRGMDPEEPYHTRNTIQRPTGRVNPSQNF